MADLYCFQASSFVLCFTGGFAFRWNSCRERRTRRWGECTVQFEKSMQCLVVRTGKAFPTRLIKRFSIVSRTRYVYISSHNSLLWSGLIPHWSGRVSEDDSTLPAADLSGLLALWGQYIVDDAAVCAEMSGDNCGVECLGWMCAIVLIVLSLEKIRWSWIGSC